MVPLSIMDSMLQSAEDVKLDSHLSGSNENDEVTCTVAEFDTFLDAHAKLCRYFIRADAIALARDRD